MGTKRRAHPPDPLVAERIGMAIRLSGLRPADVARGIGVTPGAISQWMTGSVAVREQNIRKLAMFLDEDAEVLLGRKNTSERGVGLFLANLAEGAGLEGVQWLKSLTPKQLGRLVDIGRVAIPSEDAQEPESSKKP